jgi:hypothetical protein
MTSVELRVAVATAVPLAAFPLRTQACGEHIVGGGRLTSKICRAHSLGDVIPVGEMRAAAPLRQKFARKSDR